MAVLARFIRNAERWSQIADADADWWESDGFPHRVLAEFSDEKGISLWRLENPEDPELDWIVAAHVFRDIEKLQLNSIEVRFIDEEDLEKIAPVKSTPGSLKDQRTSKFHRIIPPISGPRVVELVTKLKNPRVFRGDQVATLVVRSINSKRLEEPVVKKKLKELLPELHKHKLIKILGKPEV